MRAKIEFRWLILVFAIIFVDFTKVNAQLVDSPWPMFQHDAQHTGRSIYSGPQNPQVAWKFNFSVFSQPVIGEDNTIYISVGGDPCALYPDGTIKWIYEFGGSISIESDALAISKDGTIYFATDQYKDSPIDPAFYALNSDGTLKWRYENIKSGSTPTIGPDGTIYICSKSSMIAGGDSRLYAFNPDGTVNWDYEISAYCDDRPALSADNSLYIVIGNGLWAFDSNGNFKWKFDDLGYRGNWGQNCSPAVAPDGTIFIGSVNGKIYIFYPTGILKNTYQTDGIIQRSPCIGTDGTAYFLSTKVWDWDPPKGIYAIRTDGTLKWKKEGHFSSDLSIDLNGILYVSSRSEEKLYPKKVIFQQELVLIY